ncbi:spore coat protein [Desmospora profundinema]|uniref:Spore coat protein n=1 Tax=Desmospora profundinema TaxID=1571184 RepID=A0ABU1IJC6_9BACL|nr:spore coat protein [Desmospora profundinema]MDR6224880.1 hypothetical protein [Desmospora profundinema]
MNLAVHEAAEVHELLMFKNCCAAKAGMMQNMVQDPQLKALIQQDLQTGRQHIQQLQGLLSNAQVQ